ncbi:MAG: hypothetical protein ACLPV2_04495 [Steroidobacteraceae bacterium]
MKMVRSIRWKIAEHAPLWVATSRFCRPPWHEHDALWNFIIHNRETSIRIARLEYGAKLEAACKKVTEEARRMEEKAAQSGDPKMKRDAEWAAAIAKETQIRLAWEMSPQYEPGQTAYLRWRFGWRWPVMWLFARIRGARWDDK